MGSCTCLIMLEPDSKTDCQMSFMTIAEMDAWVSFSTCYRDIAGAAKGSQHLLSSEAALLHLSTRRAHALQGLSAPVLARPTFPQHDTDATLGGRKMSSEPQNCRKYQEQEHRHQPWSVNCQ